MGVGSESIVLIAAAERRRRKGLPSLFGWTSNACETARPWHREIRVEEGPEDGGYVHRGRWLGCSRSSIEALAEVPALVLVLVPVFCRCRERVHKMVWLRRSECAALGLRLGVTHSLLYIKSSWVEGLTFDHLLPAAAATREVTSPCAAAAPISCLASVLQTPCARSSAR